MPELYIGEVVDDDEHDWAVLDNARFEARRLALLRSQITHTVIKPVIVPGREGVCDWVYYAQLPAPPGERSIVPFVIGLSFLIPTFCLVGGILFYYMMQGN